MRVVSEFGWVEHRRGLVNKVVPISLGSMVEGGIANPADKK
jgi:hypothetical protein